MVEDPATGEKVNRHRNTENLAFAVTMGGFRFFHNGDANLLSADNYCRFRLNPPGLDVAFLGGLPWPPVEKGFDTVRRCLAPRHVVPMHLNTDQKAPVGELLGAHRAALPRFVVPSAPMSEVVLP
jgi:L-ascorbate metabolism protein UlaG (beta-lactamase superfamily)